MNKKILLNSFFFSLVFLFLPITLVHAATLNISSGALTFTDTAGENNNVTVTVGSGVNAGYSFNDAATKIILGPGAIAAGWRGSNTNTVSGLASTASSITINPDGGINTINLRSLVTPTTVNGQTGTTSINISSTASTNNGNLAGIKAPVTINAGSSTNLWVADVTGTSRPNTIVVNSSSISGLALNPINYTGTFASLRVSGSTSATLAESYDVSAPPTNNFRLDTNSGQDTVIISGDTTGDIYCGAGDDTLTVLAEATLYGNVYGGVGTNTYYYGAPDYGTITGTVN